MIFADKLIDLRKKNGWSQEELAEKLNVSRQAVSKWEGAQSIPDMTRIIQLSELFHVSTDYLLKDEIEQAEGAVVSQDDTADIAARTIGMEEANTFLKIKEENSRRVAVAVMLCILSPVALILLGGAQSFGLLKWTENMAGGIGLVVMMLMIIPAVGMFIQSGLKISKFNYLEKEPVETLYGVSGMARERKERFQPVHTRHILFGIMLCVASCVPLFVSIIFKAESFISVVGIAAILVLAAIGVMLIVRVSIIQGSYQMLLEEEEYSRESKENNKHTGYISVAYWCLVTAGFLAWSFIGNAWRDSWIIWPVAGVAYGAVAAISSAMRKR
ncbi:MAG: helix-turn-helix transcriptional regulator [Clostridia bacterium]|nr:helix-turn-helix transcriptional regulator [Clostridia bacterium]